jgi:phosphohistidine swiveling domain-containing protein
MASCVVRLSARRARRPSLAGGKGAGLARLAWAGFPVPPGFVITTSAFRAPLDAALGLPGLDAARRFCLEWAIPPAPRRSILAAYRRLASGPVAVRSSLVGEDAASASFAGQLESVLDVTGDAALLEAVRYVLASAFGDRLWDYLHRPDTAASIAQAGSTLSRSVPRGAPVPPLALAVVVQAMVPAEVSGVAFSLDPVTCRPGVVIEAVPGLAQDLVRGRARPDRYRLDPRGELSESVPVRPGAPLLDEIRARALGALVHEIAAFAEEPQDVEWAFDSGGFHILQSRPISSIAGKPVYSRRMVSDMAPGLVKPLVWSAKYAPIVQNVFAPVFEKLAGPTGIDYSAMSVLLYSRVYMNTSVFGEIFKRLGLPPNFFDVLAREDKAARRMFRFRLGRLPALVRHVRFVRRESRIGRRVGPFLESHRRELDAFRTLDWSAEIPDALLGHFARLRALHGRTQWYVILVSVNMLLRSRVLGRMIVRRWPGTDPRDVIKGYGRRSSLVPFEEIRSLAEAARGLERGLLERMAGPDAFDVAAALAALVPAAAGLGDVLTARFDRFMSRFGFLSANGSDFSETPWIENPRTIWRTIGRLALQTDAGPSPAQAEAHRDEVLGLVRAGFGPLRRRVFDRLHASTVLYMEFRERISLAMTEDSYWMRRCLLALGAELVARGVVAEASDVFYFFEDELALAVRDPAAAAAAAGLVSSRKAELVRDASLDPPETLCGGEPSPVAGPPAEGLEVLSGIGASAGIRTGRARVVHDPAFEGGGLGAGDILIVPFTDVGWMPILSGVGGIVAESGGQLSHTAIIAREFGIPAVVSVGNATRLIRDGQTVQVDGTAGRVYLRPDGEA